MAIFNITIMKIAWNLIGHITPFPTDGPEGEYPIMALSITVIVNQSPTGY
jgi:hypothetical protein